MRRVIVLVVGVAALVAAGSASAATTAVTPAALGPWQTFLTDGAGNPLPPGDGGVTFVQGPAPAPVGIGSARLVTPVNRGDGSAQLRTTGYDGTPLSAFRALSYATFVTASNGTQVPFLRLTLDLDGNGSPDDAIFFEPYYQSGQTFAVPAQPAIQLGVWQLWDARRGGWWSQNGIAGATPGPGVKTLDQIAAAAPGARVIKEGAAGGFTLASGVVAAPARFDANVDGLTVDSSSGPTTFDFEPAPPPPVRGESVVINEVRGTVRVRPPGASTHRVLRAGENVPVGTIVDARRGRAKLSLAVNRRGRRTQRADFFDGVFQVRQQSRSRLTTITLRVANFARLCGRRRSSRGRGSEAEVAQKRRRSRKSVGRVWGNGRGRFRTKGRNSAATVRGTQWLTQERCDGTLTRVVRGVVDVRDDRTGRTIRLRRGQSYLARRP